MTSSDELHVVHVITQFPPHVTTGVGRYVEAIHPHLTDTSRVHVVTLNPGRLPPVERHGRLTVERTRGRLLGRVFAGRRPNHTRRTDFVLLTLDVLVNNLRFFARVRRLLRHGRVDVIALHDSTTFVTALLCHRFLAVPLVFHLHSTEYTVAPQRVIPDPFDLFRAIERAVGRRAARTVVATPELRDTLVADGWERERIDVVALGNPLEVAAEMAPEDLATEARTARERLCVPPEATVVLFVGRLAAQKGVRPLVSAMPAVTAIEPDVHLVMVGDGETAALRALARALGVERHVTLTGRFVDADELVGIYGLADVCIFPSLFEPFGLVALEAMGFGRPVLLGNGFSAVFAGDGDESAVHRVDGSDPEDIARGLLEVLGDDALREGLARRGAGLVRERFSWRRTAESTLDVYRQVADREA